MGRKEPLFPLVPCFLDLGKFSETLTTRLFCFFSSAAAGPEESGGPDRNLPLGPLAGAAGPLPAGPVPVLRASPGGGGQRGAPSTPGGGPGRHNPQRPVSQGAGSHGAGGLPPRLSSGSGQEQDGEGNGEPLAGGEG